MGRNDRATHCRKNEFGPNRGCFQWIGHRTFAPKLTAFLLDNGVEGKVTIAGKNPAFDAQWLPPIYEFRMIDPAIWYMEVQVPGLATCLKRAGLEVGNIHDAAYDAKAIVQLIRNHYS